MCFNSFRRKDIYDKTSTRKDPHHQDPGRRSASVGTRRMGRIGSSGHSRIGFQNTGGIIEQEIPPPLHYEVPQDEAIGVLGTKSMRAALWWSEHGYPQDGGCFCFKAKDVKEVSALTKVKTVRIHQFVGMEFIGVGAHDHPANRAD